MDAQQNWKTPNRKEILGKRLGNEPVHAVRPGSRLRSNVVSAQKVTERAWLNDLLSNRLLAALPVDEFEQLLPHIEPVTLAAGEDLYPFDEAIRFAYFPETAVISYLHVLADGETAETVMIGREGMTGVSALFKSRQPNFWSQNLIGGTAMRISLEVVQREFRRGLSLQRLILSYVCDRLTQISQRAVCDLHHNVEERLCSWLLMARDRADEERIQLTHERISSHLGVRRAGITCAANVLKDRGIIGYSRGVLWIRDRQKLEATACECYRLISQPAIR